jgi:hypothetical protein
MAKGLPKIVGTDHSKALVMRLADVTTGTGSDFRVFLVSAVHWLAPSKFRPGAGTLIAI